jgi:hypothetical protein
MISSGNIFAGIIFKLHGRESRGFRYAKAAQLARDSMLTAMRQLQSLGEKVARERIKASEAVPPAIDLEATGTDEKSKTKGGRTRSAKKRNGKS